MSFALPPRDSELRELFEIRDVVKIGENPRDRWVPSTEEATTRGRDMLTRDPVMSAVHFLAKTEDGRLVLFKVGRTMTGYLWDFGAMP